MCTAISYLSGSHYFGRNLDLEVSYGETITITPRNFPLILRNGKVYRNHHAIIGTSFVSDNYPLYFDGTNEKGLSIAALNFPKNAHYYPYKDGTLNIASFEVIPWLLSLCCSVKEVKEKLSRVTIWNEPFSSKLPTSPLHWLISDRNESIVLESTDDGLHIYDNPLGVLTNNPPFPYHLTNMANYMHLTPDPPKNNLSIPMEPYSFGMGAIGLPGDLSSASRFVRAAFTKMHCTAHERESENVTQFFHILNSVLQTKGLNRLSNGLPEFTRYTSCCNTDLGIYYYTTYHDATIHAVSLHRTNLDGAHLISYQMEEKNSIHYQN